LNEPSWFAWRVFLRALFALPLDAAELEVFRRFTGRAAPPPEVREAWCVVGRRGGNMGPHARRGVLPQAADFVHAHADYYDREIEMYLRERAAEFGTPSE
jgi:hypothetical protein